MKQGTFKGLQSAVALLLLIECSGCGYIMHPDRRGQTGGQVDVTIALLDGVGVLLFVVPGVIAFIVDFSTGAIYLPHSNHAGSLRGETMDRVSLDTRHGARVAIERMLLEQRGISLRLDRGDLIVTRVSSVDGAASALPAAEAGARPSMLASASGR